MERELEELAALMAPRVGKRATGQVLDNLRRMAASDASLAVQRTSLQQIRDAYARIPPAGTPFPLPIAKAILDAACPKLPQLNVRQRAHKEYRLVTLDVFADGVAQHADALLPAYGEDDAEFAVRVAFKNAHHFHNHLVVGRSYNRNEPTPTALLDEAWRKQGMSGVPVAVVPADAGPPGVIYAEGSAPTANVRERFHAGAFVFVPDDGEPLFLSEPVGIQTFLAAHPLPITPATLAWIVHLVRMAFPGQFVDVEGGLTVEWEPKEDEETPQAASMLLGIAPVPAQQRARIALKLGDDDVLAYERGELSVSRGSIRVFSQLRRD